MMEIENFPVLKSHVQILMLGLDNGGKTTLLYRLKLGNEHKLKIIPTIGYNVETVEFEGKNYTIWDIGGNDTVRVLWKFYAENKDAVVFVVDASNPTSLPDSKDFLHSIMAHENLNKATLLIISNKHDKANCLTNDELKEKLNFKILKQPVHIINTSANDQQTLQNIMVKLRDVI